MYDLIIIGLGPAGINASIYAKRSNLNVLVIEKGMPGGMLHHIKDVENYLGYEHINGSDLAMNFYKQFKELKVPMVNDEIIDIEINDNIKNVIGINNTYQAKSIIIATGRGPKKLGLPNENIKGVSTCTLCDGSFYYQKDVALFGNNIIDDALYLSNIVNRLFIITKNSKLIGDENLIKKLNDNDKIEIIYNEEIKEIIGNSKIEAIVLKERKLKINGLFINNDYGPITDFVKNLNILDEKNYIIVNEKQETSINGIFACGDCTKKDIYQIITSASEGASAAINAYKYIKKS